MPAKAPVGAHQRSGGCLCGAVRYTLLWPPLDLVTCSCRHCQKQSGGALSVVAIVGCEMLQVEGELATYNDIGNSGLDVWRRFCPTCGSPILTDTPNALESGIRLLKAGTLDDTTDLKPSSHYWTERAQAWVRFPPADRVAQREETPVAPNGKDHQCRQ